MEGTLLPSILGHTFPADQRVRRLLAQENSDSVDLPFWKTDHLLRLCELQMLVCEVECGVICADQQVMVLKATLVCFTLLYFALVSGRHMLEARCTGRNDCTQVCETAVTSGATAAQSRTSCGRCLQLMCSEMLHCLPFQDTSSVKFIQPHPVQTQNDNSRFLTEFTGC